MLRAVLVIFVPIYDFLTLTEQSVELSYTQTIRESDYS